MEKKIEVVNNKGQLVVSSMQVAENFGKQHKDVLKSIESIKAQNCAVTSMQVAENFGKQHKHVLEAIDNLKAENSTLRKMFYENTYKVADHFEKQHKHVLEAIDNLVAENSTLRKMFYENTYKVAGNNKSYKMYLMNRDGFSLLAMGFTGSKALEWKLKSFS